MLAETEGARGRWTPLATPSCDTLFCLQYHFNPSQSVLVMEGDDMGNINSALQKVSYINSRQFPTAGVRRLKVSSQVQ